MKCFVLLFLLAFSTPNYSQQNFRWDKIVEVNNSKDQLFDKTELWIANVFVDSKEVVQLRDQESHLIVVKGIVTARIKYQLEIRAYQYKYTINFQFKDGKCRIILDNVTCFNAFSEYNQKSMPCFEPYDTAEPPGYIWLTKKKGLSLMQNLKYEIESIVNDYKLYMQSARINDDW